MFQGVKDQQGKTILAKDFDLLAQVNVPITSLAARNDIKLERSETRKVSGTIRFIEMNDGRVFGMHKSPERGDVTLIYNRPNIDKNPADILIALKINDYEITDTSNDMQELKSALAWRATPKA